MQYPTSRNAPIAFTGIRPFPRFPTRDATLLQAGKTCTYPLPTLPYIHSKTTIVPLRCFDYKIFHIGITIVCQPTSAVLRQVEFQPSVALTTTTAGQVLDGAFELGLTFLMKIKTTFTVGSSVEGVSKILLAADGTDFCLLFVYFQE